LRLSVALTDDLGNQGQDVFAEIAKDTIPPATTDDAPAEWQGDVFMFNLNCDDGIGFGCAVTYFTIDGGEEQNGNVVSVMTDGEHEITYYSIDNAGNIEAEKTTYARLDMQNPSYAEVTFPSEGSVNGGIVSLMANADDFLSGIERVEFVNNNGEIGEDTEAPYSVDWDTISTLDGNYFIYAVAYDNVGLFLSSAPVNVIVDNTPPIVYVPEVASAEATSFDGAAVEFAVSASDAVDGDVPAICDYNSGDLFPLGITPVTCTAIDSVGNVGESTFNVEVVDTTAPNLNLPQDITQEATGADGAVVDFEVMADDIADFSVDISCDYNSGDIFALGTTSVSCTATDDSGNAAQGSFNINVADTTAPIITLTGDASVDVYVGDEYADAGATAEDIVGGDLTEDIAIVNPVDTSVAGTYVITYDVTDASENAATQVTRNVNVLELPVEQQSSGGGGGGIMGGFCNSNWECSNWSACVNNAETRTCVKSSPSCASTPKPDETRACTINEQGAGNGIIETPTAGSSTTGGITGAIIGALSSARTWIVIVFLAGIGIAYALVARMRKKSLAGKVSAETAEIGAD
jgi:hypothetical protein